MLDRLIKHLQTLCKELYGVEIILYDCLESRVLYDVNDENNAGFAEIDSESIIVIDTTPVYNGSDLGWNLFLQCAIDCFYLCFLPIMLIESFIIMLFYISMLIFYGYTGKYASHMLLLIFCIIGVHTITFLCRYFPKHKKTLLFVCGVIIMILNLTSIIGLFNRYNCYNTQMPGTTC